MSTSKDRIVEALEQSPQGLCDDCLSKMGGVTPRQQVNQLCRRFADHGLIERAKRKCRLCGANKLVNRLRASFDTEAQLGHVNQTASAKQALQWKDAAADLDHIRRGVVEILNCVEGASKREGLSARITRLREDNNLPGNIACMMLTLNSLRNLAVYEQYLPGQNEQTVIKAAWSAVEEWWASKAK